MLYYWLLLLLLLYSTDTPQIPSPKIPRQFELPISLRPPIVQPNSKDISSFIGSNLNPAMLKLLDDKPPSEVIFSNCSLPRKSKDSCSFVQFEALVNLADRTVCKCSQSRITIGDKCGNHNEKTEVKDARTADFKEVDSKSTDDDVSIFAITPTYVRLTQKVDLTSLCYTIQNIPHVIWIVVEDSRRKTDLVVRVLQRCKVRVQAMHNIIFWSVLPNIGEIILRRVCVNIQISCAH